MGPALAQPLQAFVQSILLGMAALLPEMLQAQISGTVTDSLTREPVPYIAVYYDGKGVGSITDSCGVYTVETREGWDELTFSAVGYEKKVVKIVPTAPQSKSMMPVT